jgi:hypothetical protein
MERLLASETHCCAQLESFAKQSGDDDEVRDAFASHAHQALSSIHLLDGRLQQLPGGVSMQNESVTDLLAHASKLARTRVPEEEIVQNLILAYGLQSGIIALCEALVVSSQSSPDDTSIGLARELQAQHLRASEEVWRFISSRSKIAYNVLTAGEIDPSIDTRTVENRLI